MSEAVVEETENQEPEGEPEGDNEPTLESLQEELQRAKREHAATKRQLTMARKEIPKPKEEGEKPDAKLEELEGKLRAAEDRERRATAVSIAATLNAVDPEDAVKLLDWDAIADPSNKTEVREALVDLLTEKPHLVAGKRDLDAGRSGGGKQKAIDMNDIFRGIRRN